MVLGWVEEMFLVLNSESKSKSVADLVCACVCVWGGGGGCAVGAKGIRGIPYSKDYKSN